MMKLGMTAVAAAMLLVTSVVAQAEDLKIGFLTPIQDFYLVQAIRRDDGKYATTVKQKIFDDHADRQSEKYPM